MYEVTVVVLTAEKAKERVSPVTLPWTAVESLAAARGLIDAQFEEIEPRMASGEVLEVQWAVRVKK